MNNREFKEIFFQTPIWYLRNELEWITHCDIKSIKRLLHKPDTSYGLGKIIEISLYPGTTATFSAQLEPQQAVDVLDWVDLEVTQIQTSGQRTLFVFNPETEKTPQNLERHLLGFWETLKKTKTSHYLARELDIKPSEIGNYLDDLNFEKGIMIETLTT